MQDTRSYHAYPSNLDVLEAFKKLESYIAKSGFSPDPHSGCRNAEYRIEPTSNRTLNASSFAEFMEVLAQFPHSMPISLHAHFINRDKQPVTCILHIGKASLTVTIQSKDVNILSAFHERTKEFFQASNPFDDEHKAAARYGLKKTIFLAHRFDEHGHKVSANLSEFLRRLGFEVLEGAGYEARDIPDKVMDRIQSQDIFICLVTAGDPSWILSEASSAHAIGKYLIILCEKGVTFNRGIIGKDYEYMEFPEDNIEKTYSDLLYALPSSR